MTRVEEIEERLMSIYHSDTAGVPYYSPTPDWFYHAPYDISYLLIRNKRMIEVLELLRVDEYVAAKRLAMLQLTHSKESK